MKRFFRHWSLDEALSHIVPGIIFGVIFGVLLIVVLHVFAAMLRVEDHSIYQQIERYPR